MKPFEKQPMLAIFVGVLGISLSSIFVRYSSAPSAVTAAWRLLWSVILLTPVTFVRRHTRMEFRQMRRRDFLLSALSGVFLAAHFWLWFESLLHTTIASSTTIVCTEVVWVSLGYCLFMKGRLSIKAVLAVSVTLLGSFMITCTDSLTGSSHLYGDFLALLAAIAVAAYTLIGRIVRKTVSTTVYTCVVYIACAASLITASLAQGQNPFAYGPEAAIVGFLLAVFSTILGHSIFSWCLKYFSPSFVSASKLCEPVFASILAAFLFGELPSLLQIAGGIMILGGVMYYSYIENRPT